MAFSDKKAHCNERKGKKLYGSNAKNEKEKLIEVKDGEKFKAQKNDLISKSYEHYDTIDPVKKHPFTFSDLTEQY